MKGFRVRCELQAELGMPQDQKRVVEEMILLKSPVRQCSYELRFPSIDVITLVSKKVVFQPHNLPPLMPLR